MILYLEDDGVRSRVGLMDDEEVRWTEAASKGLPSCLDAVMDALRARRPAAIVAALTGEGRSATWSGIRAMTAVGNAFGFAWQVPAVAVDVPKGTSEADLVERVKDAAANASPGAVLTARYDGQPNITSPGRKD
jgi:hypothetical protein